MVKIDGPILPAEVVPVAFLRYCDSGGAGPLQNVGPSFKAAQIQGSCQACGPEY